MNTSLLPFVNTGQEWRIDLRKPRACTPTCPHCHSTDVRRFSEMHGATGRPVQADQSQRGYALGIFKGEPVIQTCQERRMIPASSPKGVRFFLLSMICVGAVVLLLSLLGIAHPAYGIFAAAMALVSGFCLLESTMGRRDMSIRIRRWENSWSCLRCGRSFMS